MKLTRLTTMPAAVSGVVVPGGAPAELCVKLPASAGAKGILITLTPRG